MTSLERLAREAGIAVRWRDADGRPRRVSRQSLIAILAALGHPANSVTEIRRSLAEIKKGRGDPPLLVVRQGARFAAKGRSLRLFAEDGAAHTLPIRRGQAAADLASGYYRVGNSRRRIAITPPQAFQRHAKMWGVAAQLYALRGSPGIGDFAALGEFCEQAAQAGADAVLVSPVHALPPGGISPYTPSSRQWFNPLYIPAKGRDGGARRIDWAKVTAERMKKLASDFEKFNRDDLDFHAFLRRQEPGVNKQARFELYLQWRADAALAEAQSRARKAGMQVGLITDVAVGLDPKGREAAGAGELMLRLSIGAPPDAIGPEGQDWGLTTYSPAGLIASGYDGFIRTLRAAMRHAGGIRLDHAMGLMRLWVVPKGRPSSEGAYLHYPFEELLGLVCLESQRHCALVIAEDLGTVPPAFRRRIAQAGFLGMEVLWFARDAKGFRAPARWSPRRAALSTTHDLPTLAGWWGGRDLTWGERIAGRAGNAARRQRDHDRRALWRMLRAAGAKGAMPQDAARFADEAIKALARTPSPLVLVAIEDLIGEIEQPNLPGTVDEHPNWRRRVKTAKPFATAPARRRAALLNQGRA